MLYTFFVEGDSTLRTAFQNQFKLLCPEAKVNVKMCGDKGKAINQFLSFAKTSSSTNNLVLVVDSDCHPTQIATDSKHQKLLSNPSLKVRFMVQEMEAWFLAHPQLLTSHFNAKAQFPKVSNPQYQPKGHLESVPRTNGI